MDENGRRVGARRHHEQAGAHARLKELAAPQAEHDRRRRRRRVGRVRVEAAMTRGRHALPRRPSGARVLAHEQHATATTRVEEAQFDNNRGEHKRVGHERSAKVRGEYGEGEAGAREHRQREQVAR